MKLTRLMKKRYIKNDNKCPYCGSSHLEGNRFNSDTTCAWRNVTCHDCREEWRDVYTLVDIEEI